MLSAWLLAPQSGALRRGAYRDCNRYLNLRDISHILSHAKAVIDERPKSPNYTRKWKFFLWTMDCLWTSFLNKVEVEIVEDANGWCMEISMS